MNILTRLLNPFLACSILLAAVNAAPVSAQSQKWDATYIADDTFFVVALNVERLLGYEKKDSELRKMVEKGIRNEMGIDISELSQIQFIMGGNEDEDFERHIEDTFQAKFVFSKPQKADKLMERMFRHNKYEKAQHDGKDFFKSDLRYEPSVFWPSDQMMVIANTEHLQRIMEAERSMNEFADMLKQTEGNKDVFLSFTHNKITDYLIGQLAEEMEGLPFDIQDIASEAKRGSLVIDLADNKPLTGNIVAKDQEGAERLKRAIDALVALGKTGIPLAQKQIAAAEKDLPGDEEYQKWMQEQMKTARRGLQLADSALEGTMVAVNGNHVEVQVAVMGGVTEAAKLIGQFIGVGLMHSETIEIEGAVEEIEQDAPQDEEDSDIEELEFEDE